MKLDKFPLLMAAMQKMAPRNHIDLIRLSNEHKDSLVIAYLRDEGLEAGLALARVVESPVCPVRYKNEAYSSCELMLDYLTSLYNDWLDMQANIAQDQHEPMDRGIIPEPIKHRESDVEYYGHKPTDFN